MSLKGVGYLYFVKLDDHKNCYKIGCSCNITKRMEVLKCKFGCVSLLASGLVKNKLKHENEVKKLLYPYCNHKIISDKMSEHLNLNPLDYPGGTTSCEYLVLEGGNVYKALQEFKNYVDLWGEV